MFSNSGEKGLIRVRVDCGGKWFLISSYLLLSPQTDDRRPLSSGKRANLGQKQVYKLGQSCNLSGGQYRPLMISFQEGEEQWLWVERKKKRMAAEKSYFFKNYNVSGRGREMVMGRIERRKEWLLKKISTTTMFQEGEEEWLRLERQRQLKEKKNSTEKIFFFQQRRNYLNVWVDIAWTSLAAIAIYSFHCNGS